MILPIPFKSHALAEFSHLTRVRLEFSKGIEERVEGMSFSPENIREAIWHQVFSCLGLISIKNLMGDSKKATCVPLSMDEC